MTEPMVLKAIGVVRSPLTRLDDAPRQADEDAPGAWLELAEEYHAGLDGLRPGDDIVVLTWLHLARRDVLQVHPRGDTSRELAGVYSTRSPHRPNPIGLHRVQIVAVAPGRLQVRSLEALDGTPIIDIKPVLDEAVHLR